MERESIALSQEIGQSNHSLFVLDGVDFYPHITVYSLGIPTINQKRLLKIVESIAKETRKIRVTFKEIRSSSRGYIGIYFNVSLSIQRLHRKLLKRLNPLREGHIIKEYQNPESLSYFSQERLESIKKYGYPDARKLYKPHLTITCLKSKDLAEGIATPLKWQIKQFTIDKIAIFKMGEYGTCRSLVKEFNLSN